MKTTLVIPDPIFRALKSQAAERGETLSELVTGILRQGLETSSPKKTRLRPLQSFDMGKSLVDIADRNALYDVLERERDERLYRRARKS